MTKKKKSLNKSEKKKDDMNGKRGYMAITLFFILILLLIYTFLYPSTKFQVITIGISDTGEPRIDSIKIRYLTKPFFNIFSRNNPKGDFEIKLIITNERGKIVAVSLGNLGIGDSNFPIQGVPIEFPVTITYELYLGGEILDGDTIIMN